MITLARHRVRVRPASGEGGLAGGGYMELSCAPDCPYEVKPAGTGPDARRHAPP